jgi:hypothetical protein
MRELNELNKVVMQKFSSRQAYTFIKGQYVPIVLNNISDESQMTIDSRKYYIQNYDFTMLGYLIDEDEFEVKPAIQRVTQLMEVETSTRSRRRNSTENPDEFNFNFLYVDNNNVLTDKIDFTANMNFISSNNINTYDVYINGDYYGVDVQNIQITTNDSLTISVTKQITGQTANIQFENTLYGNTPIYFRTNSYSNNTYTLGVQSGSTFNISKNLIFKEGDKIKIVHDEKNSQNSIVVSYSPETGILVFSGATKVIGSGTYSSWDIY